MRLLELKSVIHVIEGDALLAQLLGMGFAIEEIERYQVAMATSSLLSACRKQRNGRSIEKVRVGRTRKEKKRSVHLWCIGDACSDQCIQSGSLYCEIFEQVESVLCKKGLRSMVASWRQA